MSISNLSDITEKFAEYTKNPVKFLTVQNELKDELKDLVKSLYDYTKVQDKDGNPKRISLPELIVQDFDEEQIWQQLELENNICWDSIVSDVAKCVSSKDHLQFPIKVSDEPFADDDLVDAEDIKEDEKEIESDDEDIHVKSNKIKPKLKSFKKSIVDDQFFNLNEMEQFLLKEEKAGDNSKKLETDSEEESIDMFEEEDEEDLEDQGEENNVMYSDFFDGENVMVENNNKQDQEEIDETIKEPKQTRKEKKSVRFANIEEKSPSEESDLEANMNNIITETRSLEKQSSFEQRQLRLKQQISKLEDKTLSEAPWQMKGEVDASKRPQNSLLEEIIDFDLTSRPAPIITEETTFTLEDLIKQRIKDKAWDDVVKKAKPVDDVLEFRKPEILDHSKSKLSLAQVYEAEYLKQKHGTEDEMKEPEAHTQIRDDMTKLFAKLDALSNYHYTPKVHQPEVKIVSNTPTISMEEVAPVATSNSALLAPEEVKRKKKGELMSKEERTSTDKKRERRKKKQHQKEKGKFEKK